MNKKECNIVKDLSLGYIENILSESSKEYVEKHLLECSNCKEYYKSMKTNILDDNTDKEEDTIEFNYLKKVKKQINWLKIIIVVIISLIVLTVTHFAIKYIRLNNIIETSYQTLESLKSLDNYKISRRTIYKVYGDENSSFDVTFNDYYKDGKYRIEYGENSTFYLEDDGNYKISVFDDLEQIDYQKRNFSEVHKGSEIESYYNEILNCKNSYPKLFMLNLNLREEYFNGKKCYVIRRGDKDGFLEIWINKNSNMIVRTLEQDNFKYYSEEIYTFTTDIVKDEDVDSSILKTEKYKDYKVVEEEHYMSEEEKKLYRVK